VLSPTVCYSLRLEMSKSATEESGIGRMGSVPNTF
jgi:hypothetical protein